MDVVHKHKPSALDSALVSNADKDTWLPETKEVAGDQVIHVMPKHLDPQAEVIVFVASAPVLPGKKNDLNSSSLLDFVVSYPEEADLSTPTLSNTTHLKALVDQDHPSGPAEGAVSNGQQSMIIAVAYLDQPGWTVRNNLSTFNLDGYGRIVPDIKKAVLTIKKSYKVNLDAARALVASGIDALDYSVFTRKLEDRTLENVASKMRLDLGWSVWKKPKTEGEGEEGEGGEDQEPEATEIDFALIFYNLAGEEVQRVDGGNAEAEGVKVGREFEPDPEPEEEKPEPEEEEGKEEGEGEEEGGEEKAEALPPAPPLKPKEDPYAFTLKQTVFLDLAAIPKDARTAILVVSNYAGAGFQHVRHVRVKGFDVSNGEDSAMQKAPAVDTSKQIIDYGLISKFGADAKTSQVVLLKLYKEYKDSSYSFCTAMEDVQSTKSTIPDFIYALVGGRQVRSALKKFQDEHKKFKAEEARLLAKAEEDGEELTYEIRKSSWRYSVPSLMLPGASLEEAEYDVKNVVSFDGPLVAGETRTFRTARAVHANGDTFFGSYLDDLKQGPGIYLFAAGAAYIGEYAQGKRQGTGVMIMPDGGLYEGSFKSDKFDGEGVYRYPDGSYYSGEWSAGQKEGKGIYWDVAKGCTRGTWRKNILHGEATYDQPAMRLKGEFVRGVPAGSCTYTIVSHRMLDMDCFAASHLLLGTEVGLGPTLSMTATYSIPKGSGDEPQVDEEGNVVEDDVSAH